MLFEKRFWSGIADGTVTVAFRRWARRRAVAGARHRTPGGTIVIDSVEVVDATTIDDDDARRAGYPSADAVRADLRGDPDLPVHRVAFHLDRSPDARAVLAAQHTLGEDDVDAIDRRLDRLDAGAAAGAWTRPTLALVAARPGTPARVLAEELGRDRDTFKRDVRKLKALGLTVSLERGYRLSPRGSAYLAADARRARSRRG